MTETLKMPSWPEFAKGIAEMYVDCARRASDAASSDDEKAAREFEKLANRCKRMMDKNGITIRNA